MSLLQFFLNGKPGILSEKQTGAVLNTSSLVPTSILSLSIGLGTGSIAILDTNFSSAIAQITISTPQEFTIDRTISQVNLLFVNPNLGNDQTANGSKIAPFQTITQALRLAGPNTVIILAPGTYSQQTGEVFPLILKPGVAIQGNTANQGRGVNIVGGGNYLSRSFGRKNVAIVGANQSSLSGVTVTNTNRRGYGLWIESANTIVAENSFTGNTQDGIAVAGTATPIISKNYFRGNGANGITTSGYSRPEIRDNTLQRTGFGINIVENSAPLIVGNQIANNRSGIIVQANTIPILRNNLIQGNKEDGLVVIYYGTPDLGNRTEPGGNQFRNNRRYDINAETAKKVVYTFGNKFNKNRIIGNIDTSGKIVASVSRSGRNSLSPQKIPTNREIVFANPNLPKNFNTSGVTLYSPNNRTENSKLPQLVAANLQTSLPRNNDDSRSNQKQYTSELDDVQLAPEVVEPRVVKPRVVEPGVVEFVAPQLKRDIIARNTRTNKPVIVNNSRAVLVTRRYAVRPGTRYRVIVPVTNQVEEALVRSVVADAFPRVSQGYKFMQAGVFSSQENAVRMLQILNSEGLRAIVQPIN